MQKEINKNMNSRQAFIYATEKAGIKIQYYLDTGDESYMDQAMSYIRTANILIKEMNDEIN